VCLRVLSRI